MKSIVRKYNVKSFVTIKTKGFIHILICIRKKFPLKLIIACDIDPAIFPPDTRFPHPVGIVISPYSKIGHGCVIRQNVTIGIRRPKLPDLTAPIIGNNVDIGASAIILGNVKIGDNAIIGAGSIVLADVPENTTIMGIWK